MKKGLFLVLSCLCFALSVQAQKALPDVTLKTLDGKSIALKDAITPGKVTVVSVWATWCKPCHQELDAIAEIYEDWQEEFDMELIAVSMDTQRALAKVPGLVQTHGWEYKILTDTNQSLRNALNFQSIPQTFVIDKNGKIVHTHSGYTPGAEFELEDEIKALAKAK